MASEQCERCDREGCAFAAGSYAASDARECASLAVDWRQRALLAESVVEAARKASETYLAMTGEVKVSARFGMAMAALRTALDAHRSKR